jgi:PAS domain S-box-containing protein
VTGSKLQTGTRDYVFTILLCALALPLTLALPGAHNNPILAFFLAAIAASAWRGGWQCAVLAVVLILIEAASLIFPPLHTLFSSPILITRFVAMIAVTTGTAIVFSHLRTSQHRNRELLANEREARKAAELAAARVQESEAKFRSLFDNSLDAILLTVPNGTITGANPAACALFGMSEERICQLGRDGLIDPDDPRHATALEQRTRTGKMNTELSYVRNDGTKFTAEVSSVVFGGESPRSFVVIRDVTERKRAEEDLRESERFLRTVIDLVPHLIFVKDRESRYLLVNRACAEAYGTTSAQMVGRHTSEVVSDPSHAEAFMKADREVLDGGTAKFIAEEEIRDASGGMRLHQTNKVPFVSSRTGEAALIGVSVDITDYKQAEQALAESEARLRAIVELAPDAILVVSKQGRILEVNEAACRQIGYTREQLLQLKIFDIVAPQFAARAAARQRGEVPSGTYEGGYLRADGVEVPIELSITDIVFRGEPAFLEITRDISERKRAERALRESTADLAAAQQLAHIGSWQWDIQSDTLRWSDETFRIFDLPREKQIKRREVLARIHPADRERLFAAQKDALSGAKEYDLEYRLCLPDSSDKVIYSQGAVLRKNDGTPVAMHGIVQDITERKRAEEERAKLHSQLLLAQKLESVGQLAGGVAHDFNNLLQVINGYSDLLLRKLKKGDPLREQVAEIRRAGEQGAALTKQLLVFSREQIVEPKPLDLNSLINDSKAMLQRLMGEDIEVETSLSLALGLVMADPGRLHQVLMNLAANSRDAMPRGGKFTIRTANVDISEAETAGSLGLTPGRFLLLQIGDTGSGIPKEFQERIFDPFFTTKGPGKGTGLGLATVYGIVRLSGGAIMVRSEPGHGTTFDILLPRAQVSVSDTAGATTSPRNLRGVETILVVEDRPEVRKLTIAALQDGGYQVLEAAEGSEALLVAERHPGPIHLLLTDVIMPHMTGKELAEQLRRSRPEIKVLYMSGYTADVISSRGLLSSGERYIAKPFSLSSLLQKVREILEPPASASAASESR